jgi:hypothetical protein
VPAGRRRKTTPVAVRVRRWGAVTVPVLALAAAVVPVATALQPAAPDRPVTATAADSRLPARVQARAVSRSFQRPETPPPHPTDVAGLAERAIATNRDALKPRWANDHLVAWSEAGAGSRVLVAIHAGEKVLTTGSIQGPWAQIAEGKQLVWVRRNGLTRHKPATDSSAGATFASAGDVPAGVTGAPCPDGSSVESGLTTNAIKVYRAVCAAFPAVTSWGGRTGSGGDHGTGHALDIMSTGSLGSAIASYVRAHASELGVSYVIWAQHIWTVQRSSEGWRAMPDRGSTTANHFDHVHVTVY